MRRSTISLSRLSIRTVSEEHLLLRDDIEWRVTGPTRSYRKLLYAISLTGGKRLPAQPIDATHALKRSAGV